MARCCRDFFIIVDVPILFSEAIGLIIGYTTLNMSIHVHSDVALILAENLPPQFNPQRTHYASKNILFLEEIHNSGVKLNKIARMELIGDIYTK